MYAPVYRSIDKGETFLGLAWPSEVLGFIVVFVFANGHLTLLPLLCLLGGLYAALRLSARGKPPGYRVQLFFFARRRLLHGGRFLASARARRQQPLPFAAYLVEALGRRPSSSRGATS